MFKNTAVSKTSKTIQWYIYIYIQYELKLLTAVTLLWNLNSDQIKKLNRFKKKRSQFPVSTHIFWNYNISCQNFVLNFKDSSEKHTDIYLLWPVIYCHFSIILKPQFILICTLLLSTTTTSNSSRSSLERTPFQHVGIWVALSKPEEDKSVCWMSQAGILFELPVFPSCQQHQTQSWHFQTSASAMS